MLSFARSPGLTFFAVLTLAAGATGAPADEIAQPMDAAFAFSDASGGRLLALTALPNPKEYRKAVCSGGVVHAVEFFETQASQPGGTGRAIASNFDRLPGQVFHVVGEKITSVAADSLGSTCLLVKDSFLSAGKLSPAQLPAKGKAEEECTAEIQERISAVKERKLIRCSVFAWIGDRIPVMLAEFVPNATGLLASLVVSTTAGLIFHDYPAESDAEQISCWRVDDECRFPADSLQILFAISADESLRLAIAWRAPEGEDITLLESSGESFRPIVEAYRYWAPR